MLPWWHLAISLLVSYILVASLSLDMETGIKWIIAGCVFGTFIDLDHLPYAFFVFKRKAFKVIKKGIIHPKGLIKEFEGKGSLDFHAWRRMILHAITMSLVYTISLYIFPNYSLVIGVVFLVHLICDINPRWLKY